MFNAATFLCLSQARNKIPLASIIVLSLCSSFGRVEKKVGQVVMIVKIFMKVFKIKYFLMHLGFNLSRSDK
jgi:hypothetical protein